MSIFRGLGTQILEFIFLKSLDLSVGKIVKHTLPSFSVGPLINEKQLKIQVNTVYLCLFGLECRTMSFYSVSAL